MSVRRTLAWLVPLALAGCAEEVTLSISPEVVEFGELLVGRGAERTVNVLLTGRVTEARVSIDGGDGAFSLGPQAEAEVTVAAPSRLRLRFQPTSPGNGSAILAVEVHDGGAWLHAEAALLGLGVLGEDIDGDRDGSPNGEDCDDEDAHRYPGGVEVCDGVDSDCDGATGPGEDDLDQDGALLCEGDCDDTNPALYVGAPEICDGIDDNCDGLLGPHESDVDGDGLAECAGDCDDNRAAVRPGLPEACDGLDNDCDNITPADERDDDGDALAPCNGDCDDDNPSIRNGASELCDGLDDDCDGFLGVSEVDGDGDGHLQCADCDDQQVTIWPGAPEICDGIDQDCDGSAAWDEADGDGDGAFLCGDCDDGNSLIGPGFVELCDGLDDDCSGSPAPDEIDSDGDGSFACADCDDTASTVHPGAFELCDGLDTDCVGGLPGDEVDNDADGFVACAECEDGLLMAFPGAPELCDELDNDCDGVVPADEWDGDGDGWIPCDGDCDDADPAFHPSAPDLCYDVDDQDCSGAVNEGCACPMWVAPGPAPCAAAGTFVCPWATIGAALAALPNSCDAVWLQPGTYSEHLEITTDVSLVGVGGPSVTLLDGGGTGRVLDVVEDLEVVLTSLTVQGGLAEEGGGLRAIQSAIFLEDVVFTGNSCEPGGLGGGLFCEGCQPLSIAGSTFQDNDCGYAQGDDGNDGGAVYVDGGAVTIDGSFFLGNSAGDGAAMRLGSDGDSQSVLRSVFDGNHVGDGDTLWSELEGGILIIDGGDVTVANSVFTNNISDLGGGSVLIAGGSGGSAVRNCVMLWNNSPRGSGLHIEGTLFSMGLTLQGNLIGGNIGYALYAEGAWPGGFAWNDMWSNTTGSFGGGPFLGSPPTANNLGVDPLFTSATDDGDLSDDDLHLQSGSLVRDAGNPDVGWNDADGSRNDQGIYGGPLGSWP